MRKITLLSLFTILLSACSPAAVEDPNRERPFIGGANAPVEIIEFSDLECPACAQVSPQLEEYAHNNPDKVKFHYRHFPLTQHKYAAIAAEASECAHDQGKFFEFINLVFDNQKAMTKEDLRGYGQGLGLNMESYDACVADRTYQGLVRRDQADGVKRGLRGTPSIYVNGTHVQWQGVEIFDQYIDSLISG